MQLITKMNTTKFKKFTHIYKENDLKYILKCIHKCYLMIVDSKIPLSNDENSIRDVFISREYLDNSKLKKELEINNFLFDKEIQTETGRVDIRVLNMIEKLKGKDDPVYYIECKRIDDLYINQNRGLIKKYTSDGINRFIIEKYPTFMKENAMIGFIVKEIDINSCVAKINDLTKYEFIDEFEYSYKSKHTTNSKNEILLYHLMFDFSKQIIKPSPKPFLN